MAKTLRHKITFNYRAPGAKSVKLAGDFTGWQQSPVTLHKAKDGTWTTSLTLPPGTYQYRLLVDGEWQDDPQCRERQTNPFGSENCVRIVDID